MNADISSVRAWFPVTKRCVYMNHAGTGPLSLRACQSINDCLAVYTSQAEYTTERYFMHVSTCRKAVAQLLGAEPEEITFTHNTSEGLYIALSNIAFEPGDSIIVMAEVFPAARYIADYNLPQVRKHYVPFSNRDPVQVIKENYHPGIKVVLLDLVQYLSGERIDLKPLGDYCRAQNILLVVDAIQAIGAVDFSVRNTHVDYLACGAAKWLFGPSGAGFLYVNKKGFPHMKRMHTGWLGAQWTDFEHCDVLPPLHTDARMYEQGTRNVIGISALAENCRMLSEIGMEKIDCRIQALKSKLRAALQLRNYNVLTPENGAQSGIITARPETDAAAVYHRLVEHDVVVSFRSEWLRFSPHFYNTEQEIDQIAELL